MVAPTRSPHVHIQPNTAAMNRLNKTLQNTSLNPQATKQRLEDSLKSEDQHLPRKETHSVLVHASGGEDLTVMEVCFTICMCVKAPSKSQNV